MGIDTVFSLVPDDQASLFLEQAANGTDISQSVIQFVRSHLSHFSSSLHVSLFPEELSEQALGHQSLLEEDEDDDEEEEQDEEEEEDEEEQEEKANGGLRFVDDENEMVTYYDLVDKAYDYSQFDQDNKKLQKLLLRLEKQRQKWRQQNSKKRNPLGESEAKQPRTGGEDKDENHEIQVQEETDQKQQREEEKDELILDRNSVLGGAGDLSVLDMDTFGLVMSYLTDAQSMCSLSQVNKSWNLYVTQLAKKAFIERWPKASIHFVSEQRVRLEKSNNNWVVEYRDQDKRDKELLRGVFYNCDRSWSALHFLLTGTEDSGRYPLNFIMHGGVDICEMAYGAARVFSSQQVKEIQAELQKVDLKKVAQMWKPYDKGFPFLMGFHEVHHEDLEYVFIHLRGLKLFFEHAVANYPNHSLITYLS